MREHYPTLLPGEKPYEVVFLDSSMREDGTYFKDYDVHKILRQQGFDNINGEWFKCSARDVQSAVFTLKNRIENIERRTQNFKLRPEQESAIEKTIAYFKDVKNNNKHIVPHFLWNAKMRFGKTFTTYELAKKMGFKRILILTFKPAVESSWEEDLSTHLDFEGWQFVSRHTELTGEQCDKNRPIVCFGICLSFNISAINQKLNIILYCSFCHSKFDCKIFYCNFSAFQILKVVPQFLSAN